jgi:glycosyltransferase involved in cell wall biosynthesis
MKFSVIIPTWNEGFYIGASLKRLRRVSTQAPLEIIVVDGASQDDTAAQARAWADAVLEHPSANRGAQLHLGAGRATGDLLLFLPADAQLPATWQQSLEHFWLAPGLRGVAATAFTVDFGASPILRVASALANASLRWRGQARLEHGLCTTADLYREASGFPPLPCLSDIVFSRKLRSLGRLVALPERIWPSASRLHRYGLTGLALHQAWLELCYDAGMSPEELWRRHSDWAN